MKNLSSPSPTKPSGLSRSVSSSSITDLQQRFCSPKRFREANENDEEKVNLNSSRALQKAMKTPTKHFMSPTISAASKAVAPRKKVLSERNDGCGLVSPDAHNLVNPDPNYGAENLGFDGHSVRSSQNSTTPLSSRGFERDDDLLLESSCQPYDPLTNYLSPRPKFLRYNPNRRMEILHRREGDQRKRGEDPNASVDEGLIRSLSSSLEDNSLKQEDSSPDENSLKQGESSPSAEKSSPEPCRDGDTNQCNDGIKEKLEKAEEEQLSLKASDDSSLLGDGYSSSDARASDSSSTLEGYVPREDSLEPQLSDVESSDWEDDDNEEDEDEEEERHWNVTKALKALLFLLLTVLLMSIAAPPQSFVDLKQAYHKLQHHVSEAAVNDIMVSGIFFDLKQENEQNFIDADVRVGAGEMIEKLEEVSRQIGEGSETRQEVAAEVTNFYQVSDILLEELLNINDVCTIAEDMASYMEKWDKEWNIEDQTDDEVLSEKPDDSTIQFEKPEDDKIQFEKPEDGAIQFEKHEVVVWDPNQVPTGNVAVPEVASEEKVELESIEEDLRDETAAVKSCNLFQAPIEELTNEEVIRKEEKLGDGSENMADATNGIFKILESCGGEIGDAYESYKSLKLPFNEFMFNELDDQITGFSNFSTAGELQHKASLTAPAVFTSVVIGMSLLSVFVAFAALRFLHQKCKRTFSKESRPNTHKSLGAKSVEFRKAPLPLPKRAIEVEKVEHYAKPASSAHYKGNGYQKYYETPAVELLGEYVVSPFNSPFRRHEIESNPVESEASSLSISDEKRPRRKAASSANHEYSSISDYSAAQSPSYGSFTTQEKILIKEGGRDGEEYIKAVNTPVRRSSRIANRTVMSP
ncbi:hypothetical protein Sjap_012232 [Stephania japonica]|uniref:Uncharacterized protein n=1 Tax=Stephania japonica TaxID=461633 RepID=A0AAP0IWC7_9MAGN